MIAHLSSSDFRVMPWANGKGITVEMLRIERAGRLVLRLSRAMVVEDGPFSIFPGIERNLTVLSGPGFRLLKQGLSLEARLLEPVGFPGDVPVRAVDVGGPSEDFNVMTGREFPPPRVWVKPAGEAPAGAIFALAPGKIGGLAVALYDLVIADQPLPHDMMVIVVEAEGL